MTSNPEKIKTAEEFANDPMLPRLYKVQRIIKETHDTFTIDILPKNGSIISPFEAGQFNMLYVFGIGEVPISISGDPLKSNILTHTIRIVGCVTKALSKLKKNDLLGVRGPFGKGWPLTEAIGNDVLIIAGGIGLAPLRPVVYQLFSHREKFGKIILLYGTRTPNDILYKKELERWRARFDIDVLVTVDRALSGWRGNVGVVTSLIPKAHFDALNTTAFICGPEIMMRFTIMELQKRNLSTDRIFVSMERNMKCGIGLCGHCQFGPTFICKDGPVFPYEKIKNIIHIREF